MSPITSRLSQDVVVSSEVVRPTIWPKQGAKYIAFAKRMEGILNQAHGAVQEEVANMAAEAHYSFDGNDYYRGQAALDGLQFLRHTQDMLWELQREWMARVPDDDADAPNYEAEGYNVHAS